VAVSPVILQALPDPCLQGLRDHNVAIQVTSKLLQTNLFGGARRSVVVGLLGRQGRDDGSRHGNDPSLTRLWVFVSARWATSPRTILVRTEG